jgi:uncharacterized protein
MTADEIKTLLKLEPHPVEGGWFRRTYTSAGQRGVAARRAGAGHGDLLPAGAGNLLRDARARSDEIFHFYLGDPVEMLQLYPDGRSAVFTLGPDLAAGQHVQLVVPAGVWQGTRLVGEGGKWRCWAAR